MLGDFIVFFFFSFFFNSLSTCRVMTADLWHYLDDQLNGFGALLF